MASLRKMKYTTESIPVCVCTSLYGASLWKNLSLPEPSTASKVCSGLFVRENPVHPLVTFFLSRRGSLPRK